jgi:hypothetical protein
MVQMVEEARRPAVEGGKNEFVTAPGRANKFATTAGIWNEFVTTGEIPLRSVNALLV